MLSRCSILHSDALLHCCRLLRRSHLLHCCSILHCCQLLRCWRLVRCSPLHGCQLRVLRLLQLRMGPKQGLPSRQGLPRLPLLQLRQLLQGRLRGLRGSWEGTHCCAQAKSTCRRCR